MAFGARSRLVNPRLGTYFSIFASLFAALVLLALILEQLRIEDGWLRIALFVGPVVLYCAIGLAVATQDTLGFFAAGRRVPAAYSGLVLAISSLGATFIVAGCGAFFFAGFDALVLMVGAISGLVIMAMVLAPFYRKFGAFTVPSYLGRRFESKTVRLTSAIVATVPMLLVMAAELKLGGAIAGQLVGADPAIFVVLLAAIVALCVGPGGMRSFTWTAVAQAIAVLISIMAVATVVSIVVTALPIPQLANGPLVRGLVRQEVNEGLSLIGVWPLAFGLPGEGMHVLSKPYTQPFGTVGSLAFVIGSLTIAAGVASAPWLLPRVAVAPGIYEARKSLGWSTVFAGFVMLTLSSVAVFMRDFALDAVISDRIGPLPAWLKQAASLGFVSYDVAATRLDFASLAFNRDSILFALPVAAELPLVFCYVLMAAGLAAALVSAGATAVSLAAILGEDVVQGLSWEPESKENRVWISRGFVGIALIAGSALTALAPTDPLQLVLWALGLTGASLFSVLTLSIWWKRLTTAGAVCGIVSGFGVAATSIYLGESGAISVPGSIAGCFGIVASAGVALLVSVMRREASRHALEVVRDIRIPGGQIIYDRDMQRLQLKKHSRT